MAGNNRTSNPPDSDEIEVSVFGPGYGECIVLHLCNGNWFIVDSCICPETNEPVALDYLYKLNITAPVGRTQRVKRDRTVEKTIRETVKNIRKINASFGQVRLRMKVGGPTNVDLFGDALSLESIYAGVKGAVAKS